VKAATEIVVRTTGRNSWLIVRENGRPHLRKEDWRDLSKTANILDCMPDALHKDPVQDEMIGKAGANNGK
jgi:hypothetical protein